MRYYTTNKRSFVLASISMPSRLCCALIDKRSLLSCYWLRLLWWVSPSLTFACNWIRLTFARWHTSEQTNRALWSCEISEVSSLLLLRMSRFRRYSCLEMRRDVAGPVVRACSWSHGHDRSSFCNKSNTRSLGHSLLSEVCIIFLVCVWLVKTCALFGKKKLEHFLCISAFLK